MIHESYSLATTRTRGISLQGETKFTWKRKRGGACLLPTIFLSLPPSPLSVRQFPRLVKWKKNGNVSRVTLDAVAHHQEKKSYSSVLSPARQPPRWTTTKVHVIAFTQKTVPFPSPKECTAKRLLYPVTSPVRETRPFVSRQVFQRGFSVFRNFHNREILSSLQFSLQKKKKKKEKKERKRKKKPRFGNVTVFT